MPNKIIVIVISLLLTSSMTLMPAIDINAYFSPDTDRSNANATSELNLLDTITIDEAMEKELVENLETMEYKVSQPVNEEALYALKPISNYANLTAGERHALARLVYGEARGESFSGQVAIAAVVFNRINSGKFGKSILEVIFEPGAFTAVSDGQYYLEPDANAYKAVDSALSGWDPTGGAIYYWNPHTATNKWIWSRPIINQIGKHVFAL